jgi:hypothetical protein
MIMTSLGCAVLAALLAVRRPAARSLHSRLAPPTAAAGTDVYGKGRTPPRRSWTILTILIMLLGLISAAGYLGGSRAAVLATAAVLLMATVTRLVAQYRRRGSARQARADVAHACTALASYLRVGQVPSAALPIAAADCDVLREGQQAHTPSAGTWQLYGASRHSVSGTEAFLSWRVLADLDGARFATSRCRGSRRATERAAGAGSGGRRADDQILIYRSRR